MGTEGGLIDNLNTADPNYAKYLKLKDRVYSSPKNIRSIYIHKHRVSVT